MSKRARPWKIADARSALTAQVASGLSVSAFAVREGIDSDRLYLWRRLLTAKRERAAPSAPAVIELRVPPQGAIIHRNNLSCEHDHPTKML